MPMNDLVGEAKIREESRLNHETVTLEESEDFAYPLESEHIEEETGTG